MQAITDQKSYWVYKVMLWVKDLLTVSKNSMNFEKKYSQCALTSYNEIKMKSRYKNKTVKNTQ